MKLLIFFALLALSCSTYAKSLSYNYLGKCVSIETEPTTTLEFYSDLYEPNQKAAGFVSTKEEHDGEISGEAINVQFQILEDKKTLYIILDDGTLEIPIGKNKSYTMPFFNAEYICNIELMP